MMKKFNEYINENLLDKMTSKSDEEIVDAYKNLIGEDNWVKIEKGLDILNELGVEVISITKLAVQIKTWDVAEMAYGDILKIIYFHPLKKVCEEVKDTLDKYNMLSRVTFGVVKSSQSFHLSFDDLSDIKKTLKIQ